MKQPLISVIVPVYKVEPYLDKCVSSIVNQTYTNLEIILVDDGSPDNCPAMCDAWAERDSRIRVIHQKNQGGGAARNAGLDFASGSLIAFVDSDDYILTMLSLAELGVGGAIVYALYKPLAENDEEKIASLMKLYSKAYRMIGLLIAAIGLALMTFLKYIIL